MGMYSFFENEYIEVINWSGLNHFFEEWEKYQNSKKEQNEILEYTAKEEMIIKNTEGQELLTFENWDEIKLISYWYEETRIFLTLIAPYIEGDVSWTFENDDEAGRIYFENGKCIIETGSMEWTEWNAYEDIDINKLDSKLKRLIILGNLKNNKK